MRVLRYDLGDRGQLQLAYSSGAPPVQLMVERNSEAGSERGDVAACPRTWRRFPCSLVFRS